MTEFFRGDHAKKAFIIILVTLIVVTGIPVMIGGAMDAAMLHDCSAAFGSASGCATVLVTMTITFLVIFLTPFFLLSLRERELLERSLIAPLERPPQLA